MDGCYALPALTHDLTVLQYFSWVLGMASYPMGERVLCLCHCSLLAYVILIMQHIPPSLSMVKIVCSGMCSGNVLIGYVIFI